MSVELEPMPLLEFRPCSCGERSSNLLEIRGADNQIIQAVVCNSCGTLRIPQARPNQNLALSGLLSNHS
jgi:hypothetical protein